MTYLQLLPTPPRNRDGGSRRPLPTICAALPRGPPPDYPNPKNVRSVHPNGKANWKGRLITAGHAFTALPIYIDEHEDGSITISYYQTIIRTLEPGRNL